MNDTPIYVNALDVEEWATKCINLERERDEAREHLSAANHFLNKYISERADAKEQVKELVYIAGRAIDLAEIDFENDKFGVVSELRNGLEKIKEQAKC